MKDVNTFFGGTLFKMSVVSHIPSCNISRLLNTADLLFERERTMPEFQLIKRVENSIAYRPSDNRFHLPSWRLVASLRRSPLANVQYVKGISKIMLHRLMESTSATLTLLQYDWKARTRVEE